MTEGMNTAARRLGVTVADQPLNDFGLALRKLFSNSVVNLSAIEGKNGTPYSLKFL